MRFPRLAVILSLGFAVLTAALWTPWLSDNDGAGYYSIAHSLVWDSDVDLRNQYADLTERRGFAAAGRETPTGRVANQYPMGWPLVQAIGLGLARALGAAETGWEPAAVKAALILAPVLVFAGLAALATMLRRYLGIGGLGATLVVFLGTPLFFYTYFDPGMSHAASFSVAAAFVLVTLRAFGKTSASTGDWLLLGALGGALVMIRLQNGIFGVIPIVLAIRDIQARVPVGTLMARAALGGLAFLIVFAPQFMVWQLWWGEPFPGLEVQHAGHGFNPKAPNSFSVLFDPSHGLFYWHPILAVGFLGLLALRNRYLGAALVMVFVAEAWVAGSWSGWSAGQSFGQRFFIATFSLLGVGFAQLLHRSRSRPGWRALIVCVLVLGILWNGLLLTIYGARMIPSAGPVTHQEMLSAMAELPGRAPEISRTFFFDRSEFTSRKSGPE